MLRTYQYIKSRDQYRYFCLQQNPFMLFWLLFFTKNTILSANRNGFKKWSIRWIKREIREYYYYFRGNIFKLISFVKYKFRLQNSDSLVELPFYGQTCVLVNKGYKIFNLRRGVAIKVYRNDVDIPTITKELECLKNGSQFDFAPSIRRINIKERWYEEEYISGSKDYSSNPRDSKTLLEKFYKDIVPCLESLILRQFPITKNTIDYVHEIKNTLVACNLLRKELGVKNIDKILSFLHSMGERVHSEGNLPIFLVLTHGDFCPANMLNTRHGLKVIDWESATFRSALFDFYSYFFFRTLHQNLPLDKLSPEIRIAFSFYLSKLDLITPAISRSLKSFERIYRWFFYIERVYMLVVRERYDTKLNTMDNILRYIEVFNSYEEISAENTEKIYK